MNTLKCLSVEALKRGTEASDLTLPGISRFSASTLQRFTLQRFNTPLAQRLVLVFLSAAALCGCATTNTIEKRRVERAAVYESLSPEMKAAVDQGQIKVGMPMDAVYIAWGKPSQILTGESSSGRTTTWLYYGTQLQEVRYWAYRPHFWYDRCYYGAPYLEFDYYPRNYVRAEVTFENGVVKSWRSLPPPL